MLMVWASFFFLLNRDVRYDKREEGYYDEPGACGMGSSLFFLNWVLY